ncbi:hypothetical protein KC351_g2437 [Hortaea werneckii]|nr:hypothetical protein KC351_g2437 [Hortaea werneckii]
MAPHELDALDTTNKDVLTTTFETNTFGPMLVTQALLPNLLLSQAEPPRIGIVSSRVGSIADNTSGGSYAYRASKAAVNSIGKSMAVDLRDKGIVVSLLHPGYVNSNLNPGMTNPEAVEPEEAARKLWHVMQTKGLEETGLFWHREGMELPCIKIKCELGSTGGGPPCQRCTRLNKECTITPPKRQKDRVAELEAKVQALTRLLEAQGLSPDDSLLADDIHFADENAATAPSNATSSNASKKRRYEGGHETPAAVSIGNTATFQLDGIVPVHIQSRILHRYIHDVYPNFPILPVPADHTYEILRSTKPKVLQAIIYAGATGFVSVEDQERLAKLLITDEASNIMMSSPRSIEVLQALLIGCFWWWAPKNYKHVAVHQLIDAVSDMAKDLGVASDPRIPQRGLPGAAGDTDHENFDAAATWRAWLTGYMLSAAWCNYGRLPQKEAWTLHHDQTLMMLEYSPHAVPNDKLLAQYIRAESICAKIATEMELSNMDLVLDVSTKETQGKMQRLQNNVLDWQAQIPVSYRPQLALQIWHNAAILFLHEHVLHTSSNKQSFTAPFVTERLSVTDFPAPLALSQHADALAAIACSAHVLIDVYCNADLNIVLALPGLLFPPRVLYAIYILVKAYIACTALGNTYGSVFDPSDLQLEAHFDRIEKTAAKCNAVDKKSAPAVLLSSVSRMHEFYCNYKASLAFAGWDEYSTAMPVPAVQQTQSFTDINSASWSDPLLFSNDDLLEGDFGLHNMFTNAGQHSSEGVPLPDSWE